MPNPASNAIRFTPWIPHAVAVCLMALGIGLAHRVLVLNRELASAQAEAHALKQSNALVGLRLITLQAKDPAYASALVLVAWDPNRHQGVITLQNLAAPPTGRDYQLWVLDPKAQAPISAGLVTVDAASRRFETEPISTDKPGFAISLEPSGGQSTPTLPILFAVAPEE